MSQCFMKLSALTLSLACVSVLPAYAAKPIDLSEQPVNYLRNLSAPKTNLRAEAGATGNTQLEQVSAATDFNQTVHIRMKQYFNGHPVFGGDAVVHNPKGKSKTLRGLLASNETAASTMNGTVYEGLQADLNNVPAYAFSNSQAEKAFSTAISDFESKAGARADVSGSKTELMVYVDDQNKAHWVYQVSATAHVAGRLKKPIYLIDATNLKIYDAWDNLKTAATEKVQGGGFGGNIRNKLTYDGLAGNLAGFDIVRDAQLQQCYLQNDLITVTDARSDQVASFSCKATDAEHNNVYFSANFDDFNGGYSANNDALYAAKIISDMYQAWYNIPVLSKNEKPMHLDMITHFPDPDLPATDKNSPYWENAAWDDDTEKMYFGDGSTEFFPLTSLGVTAHEISHGFTSQHSNLVYNRQSGGMNESFSDMADQAAKFYTTGKTDFMIGAELAKAEDQPFRYMNQPSKDGMSINNVGQYNSTMNVHFSSGVFNRAFYLLATTEGWDVKKAFDVMVQANRFYWTSTSTFEAGANGVLKAAKDYKYDQQAVKNAFKEVGINLR